MQYDERWTYWENAVEKLFGYEEDLYSLYQKLELIFDEPIWSIYISTESTKDKPLTEKDKRLLTALAGPYGKIIFKMKLAQKGRL